MILSILLAGKIFFKILKGVALLCFKLNNVILDLLGFLIIELKRLVFSFYHGSFYLITHCQL